MHQKQAQPISTWRWALAIFALLAGIYLLTTGGHTYASDEEAMFTMTENLWTYGNLAVEQGPPLRYSQYGPGQPVAALPLYALGRLFVPLFPAEDENWLLRAILSWFNPLVTAGIGACLFVGVLRMGYGRRVAVGTALLYGLETLAWPHSKTFFAEPLTALLLVGGFVCLLDKGAHGGGALQGGEGSLVGRFLRERPVLGGVLAGAAVAVKIHAVLVVPWLGLYVLLASLDVRAGWRRLWGLSAVIAWVVGLGVALGGLALFQWAAYGNPLRTGYGGGTGEFLGNSLSPGLYGLTLSPGKGLVWYTPPLLLLPFAFWSLWRHSWRVTLTCGLIIATNILFFAQIFVWHGDGAWGPRYLNIMLPFAVLPLAAYLDQLRGWTTRWRTLALAALILLAVPVQLGGLAIHFNTYINMQRDADKRYFTVGGSPIVQHLALVGQRLGLAYDLHLAPDTAVLERGFSYSEGNRKQEDQTPRWTTPEATIALRLRGSDAAQLTLSLNSCRPSPVAPGSVTLRLDATQLTHETPCPARIYRLLLPPRSAHVTLDAEPWDPQAAGIERAGPLGVLLQRLDGSVGTTPVAVAGRLVPIPPLPPGYVGLRNWFGDPRSNHWDFWWWYLAQSGLPPRPSLLLAGIWAGLALALAGWGGWSLLRLLRGEGEEQVISQLPVTGNAPSSVV